MEAPAHGELNDGGGNDQDPVDALHRDEEPGLEHQFQQHDARGQQVHLEDRVFEGQYLGLYWHVVSLLGTWHELGLLA